MKTSRTVRPVESKIGTSLKVSSDPAERQAIAEMILRVSNHPGIRINWNHTEERLAILKEYMASEAFRSKPKGYWSSTA